MPLLSVKDLSISFGNGPEMVKGISFDLEEGQILGLVGESGSGKSITSLAIMRLLDESAKVTGCITLNGVELLALPESEMVAYRGKEISMIFQEPMSSLNPTHKCGHQVREAILIHQRISKEQAKMQVLSLFEDVLLTDVIRIYESYPHELSGGQLQRVMIAMALANNPKIIIADEPTTALDVTVQKAIVELLLSVKLKYNTSIIFISHDLGVVKAIADKVCVMQKGSIVEQGEVETIFSNARHPYSRGLIACRPPLDIDLHRLPIVQDFLDNSDLGVQALVTSLVKPDSVALAERHKLDASPNLLTVDNLSKWYVTEKTWYGSALKYKKALDNVSFSMKEGEILGIVGESGSGKSTCGRALLRLIEPTSGAVNFMGHDILALEKEPLRRLRKDFQIVFQDPYSALNPRMKIGEALIEPMTIHGLYDKQDRKERAVSLLEVVGLEADHFNRYPHQFSGGQRQRICIARTLTMQPKFIVCDESVSALDVSVQAQILNLLLDLKDQFQLSYLFISHDISVIKFFCDNVLVFKDGQIVERGSADDIYNRPKEQYTKSLIEAVYS